MCMCFYMISKFINTLFHQVNLNLRGVSLNSGSMVSLTLSVHYSLQNLYDQSDVSCSLNSLFFGLTLYYCSREKKEGEQKCSCILRFPGIMFVFLLLIVYGNIFVEY